MKAQIKQDLVTALVAGDGFGVPLPAALAALPANRLRWDGAGLVDIAGFGSFYIDPGGRKHIADHGPGWQALNCAWDAELVDDAGVWRAKSAAELLGQGRTTAQKEVDRQAERARQAYVTPGSGQAMVYDAKKSEALAWQAVVAAAGVPSLADYPFCRARAARLNGVAEGAVTQAQGQAVIDDWSGKITAWQAAGIAIEAVREQAKEDIDAAADQAAIDTVLAGLAWP